MSQHFVYLVLCMQLELFEPVFLDLISLSHMTSGLNLINQL